ncbi:hypothetical protein FIBSPDRAFT_215335 [Athelia psychrophila]|uniref:Uncharacterized protein n=1 Tax=Athelia psychrophila TaxID=1759441 RepID=A0A166SDC8_9AGAM|nr:hypothetical protein FIBSPDRAFT_215335 [Fibularhizoctonia sp. CBS 109695]
MRTTQRNNTHTWTQLRLEASDSRLLCFGSLHQRITQLHRTAGLTRVARTCSPPAPARTAPIPHNPHLPSTSTIYRLPQPSTPATPNPPFSFPYLFGSPSCLSARSSTFIFAVCILLPRNVFVVQPVRHLSTPFNPSNPSYPTPPFTRTN